MDDYKSEIKSLTEFKEKASIGKRPAIICEKLGVFFVVESHDLETFVEFNKRVWFILITISYPVR